MLIILYVVIRLTLCHHTACYKHHIVCSPFLVCSDYYSARNEPPTHHNTSYYCSTGFGSQPTPQTMASSSCKKCVSVLRELISGLQESKDGTTTTTIGNNNNNKSYSSGNTFRHSSEVDDSSHSSPPIDESPPLTLLKAIARGQQQQQQQRQQQTHQQQQQTHGEVGKNGRHTPPQHQQRHPPPSLLVEDVEDGVRLTIPVETTLPTLLRRWTRLTQYHHHLRSDGSWKNNHDDDGNDTNDLIPLHHALATSASVEEDGSQLSTRMDDNKTNAGRTVVNDPLVVELKCRKCASTGPEGGARAFLMGPQPLSVVLCHNRIASHRHEIEEILTHELVHLYDVQTMQLDLQDCENLAYSEVRAAKAAECRHSWKQLQPYCVKQKAICATNNLFPTEGRKCIQRVFDTAFADNRPFDGRQPNPNNQGRSTTS